MDIFESKDIRPMAAGGAGEPFDSPGYIFEPEPGGERLLAYLDPLSGTELRDAENRNALGNAPELLYIHKQARFKCILDGTFVIFMDGKPSLSQMQNRASDDFGTRLKSFGHPASFIAFDILYCKDREVTSLPLSERKKLLSEAVTENMRITLSRYTEKSGKELCRMAKEQGFSGVVAKRTDSGYFPGSRTKDWIKIQGPGNG